MSIVSSAPIGRIPPLTLLSLLPQKPTILSANETDASHHMAAVMELDLTACHPNSLVDRLNAMPALKTSAGKIFFFLLLYIVIFFLSFSLPFAKTRFGRVAFPFWPALELHI